MVGVTESVSESVGACIHLSGMTARPVLCVSGRERERQRQRQGDRELCVKLKEA